MRHYIWNSWPVICTHRSHKRKTWDMLVTLPCFNFVIRPLQRERKIPVRLRVVKLSCSVLHLHVRDIRHIRQGLSCDLLQFFFDSEVFSCLDKNVSCPIKQLSNNELKSSVVTMKIFEESLHDVLLSNILVFEMSAPLYTNGFVLVIANVSIIIGYLYRSVCHALECENCSKESMKPRQ